MPDNVNDEWQPVSDLDATDTRAAAESVRRAARRLAAQGQLDLGYRRWTYNHERRVRRDRPGHTGQLVSRRAAAESVSRNLTALA